jgi:hypothetical protein
MFVFLVLVYKQAEAEAKRKVIAAKGDQHNIEWVLAMTSLQFGKYREKNFIWLLENDVGWAIMLLASHDKARETASRSDDAQWDNKEALHRFYDAFFIL